MATILPRSIGRDASMPVPGRGKCADMRSTVQGLNEVTVGEARKTAKGFVAALDTPRYKALHGLLSNRRSIDVVEAACAMAIIVQPFQKA